MMKKPPVPPAVYRPQPVPKVLQTKKASAQLPQAGQSVRRPIAPPVYRPQPQKILQPKMAAALPERKAPQAPPVYRPQPVPKVLQRQPRTAPATPTPRQPNLQAQPARQHCLQRRADTKTQPAAVASRFPKPQALAQPRTAVVQRVTYDKVTYDPNSKVEQKNFLEKAKADMVRDSTWGAGRSQPIIEAIGVTTAVIDDSKALSAVEESYWKGKDYTKQFGEDMDSAAVALKSVDDNVKVLAELVTQLAVKNLKTEVDDAISKITVAISQLPGKWGVTQHTGFGKLRDEIVSYVKTEPWELGKFELALVTQNEELEKIKKDDEGKKASKKQKAKAKEIVQTGKKIVKIKADALKMVETAKSLLLVRQNIIDSIQGSAVKHYLKGLQSYISPKSKMKTQKLYLGEIETTEAIKQVGDKGRGVLWASPWSPGVNTAFLEGGVMAGSVYKLKTAVPDHLKKLLADGKADEFREAVKNQGAKEYRPFWHGLENRFTQYTDELTYLVGKGYRLHEFLRKDKSVQQIMVAAGQLDAVTKAYEGR